MDKKETQGEITIILGPNGHGKTSYLKRNYENHKKNAIFIPSEIVFSDEIKNTKSSTITMESLISNITQVQTVGDKMKNVIDEIKNQFDIKNERYKEIQKDCLSINGENSEFNAFDIQEKFTKWELFININKKVFEKMGSGQRKLFLLKLVLETDSSKEYIFLDEPDTFAHPSLQKMIAETINKLVKKGKKVFIASHSAKFISFLDFDMSSIRIFNDKKFGDEQDTYEGKIINFKSVYDELDSEFKNVLGGFCDREEKIYVEKGFEKLINKFLKYEFILCLFSSKVILCEGIADKIFIRKLIGNNNNDYIDSEIFDCYGKFLMPFFALLFKNIRSIDVICLFDEDNDKDDKHKTVNNYLKSNFSFISFKFDIEKSFGIRNVKKTDALAYIEKFEIVDKKMSELENTSIGFWNNQTENKDENKTLHQDRNHY